jgi:hypothetical protein
MLRIPTFGGLSEPKQKFRQDQSARGGQAGSTGSWIASSKLKTLSEAEALDAGEGRAARELRKRKNKLAWFCSLATASQVLSDFSDHSVALAQDRR